jgi:hypothetical protein
MGNGQAPPGIDLDTRGRIDDGTLTRAESPPPGPIGLDAKGGTKDAAPSMVERILSFARRNRGDRVGDGECFTLADRALRGAAAKSAADYGTVTADGDYVWGSAVNLSDLRPGDIIQFRGYRYDREIVTETSSEVITEQDSQERPHHTAIVQSVDGNGAVTVWEQNSPERSPVTTTQLFFTSRTVTSGSRRITIQVRGTFWFYRPEARQ